MRIPLWRMVRKRAGWLVILFLGEMLTATAMANYQDEIAKAVVLALFLPLIISSGGNSGSQASTLIIRAMALGDGRDPADLVVFNAGNNQRISETELSATLSSREYDIVARPR